VFLDVFGGPVLLHAGLVGFAHAWYLTCFLLEYMCLCHAYKWELLRVGWISKEAVKDGQVKALAFCCKCWNGKGQASDMRTSCLSSKVFSCTQRDLCMNSWCVNNGWKKSWMPGRTQYIHKARSVIYTWLWVSALVCFRPRNNPVDTIVAGEDVKTTKK
jgi:hypothetical protein